MDFRSARSTDDSICGLEEMKEHTKEPNAQTVSTHD